MIVSRIHVLYAIVATALLSVNGRTKHIITVGVSGNGFEPPTLVVGLNDTVVFVFGGDFYTVTQSTFENPFVPLPGGFSSGLANDSVLASTWELRVTDVLHPIWFFCKDTQPSPHCAAGTVGSINPPNKAVHNIFASAAKQIPCSPTPTSTATLTGHSALATNSSATVLASVNAVPSSTPPPTQASFANDNPTETSSITAVPVPRRRRGAVIGGVVAGVLGLLAILLAAGLCWHFRLRRRSRAQRDSTNPFRTREAKLNSNTLYFRPEATTPPPSASTDKRASPQLNADRIPASIQDSPLGGQQAQKQPQPQQQPDSTSPVLASSSEENKKQADPARGPPTTPGSPPDRPRPMVFARPKEAYREQQPEHSTSCAVPMSSKEESVRSPSTISGSPDRQSPVFFESPQEVYEGDLPPSTYRTAMGARLREVIRAEEAHPEYGTVIGIDLGTTYSSVGVQRGGVFEIIPNDQGQQTTPSWVCFTDKKRLVGEHAKKAFRSNPSNTVFAVKRLIGRKMDDRDIVHDMKRWPFRVSEKNGKPAITVKVKGQEKSFTPEEITAMILRKMKETAEAFLRHTVTHAVVTVPACFNDAQRQATKDAGRIAGLEIVRIINEPTAAAIAYGLKRKGVSRVIVYDLGGGFFDVSLLSIDDGVFEVLATAGNTRLGGEDFDNRVMDYLIKHYKRKTGTDVSQNLLALAKLKCEVEKAKCTLSSQHSAQIEIESETGNKFSETLTRAKFEELNIDLFQKTVKLVEQVLKDANCEKIEIDAVLLAGGSTRIPKVQELLKEFFGGKEPSKEVNPDDAIVRGAAVQGGVLSGSETAADIILVDVCPHTLGIEIVGGVFARLIPRNTVIPTKKSGPFTTVDDNQSSVLIAVFEGEHSQIKYNNLLGMFELSGIPPAPAGVPVIEVTFEIDANGIMQVRAADKGTGNSKSITIITNKGRLSQEEIMRMLADAGRFTAEGEASHK